MLGKNNEEAKGLFTGLRRQVSFKVVSEKTTMNEIRLGIARDLKLRIGGQLRQGRLAIHSIKKLDGEDECWACHWFLTDLSPQDARTFGDDPLDALLNCVRFISSVIDNEMKHGNAIWWKQEDDKAGLECLLPL
jgi:hypothetical protein